MSMLPQFWLAVSLSIAGVFILRVSWARPSRSAALNMLGWGSIVASCLLAALAHGAWGIAVSSLFAVATALLLLLPSIASPPAWKRRPVERGVHRAKGEKPRLALSRRLATFGIAGPAALAAALLLALSLRAILSGSGGAEADANVLVLACVPLFWAILSTALLMIERRRTQVAVLTVMALVGFPFTLFAG